MGAGAFSPSPPDLQQQVAQAIQRARQLGRPVVIPGAGGIVALPNGQTRMGTPLEIQQAGIPSFARPAPVVPLRPPDPLQLTPSGWDLGLNVGTPIPGTPYNPATTAPPLNQVNPTVQTYAGQAGTQGLPGSPSGPVPAGAPTPPPSQLASDAQAFRVRHGIGSPQQLTADQLNQLSLQAAQQGRTYWPPGTQVAAGQYAPNLLQRPPAVVPVVAMNQLTPQWASAARVPVSSVPLADPNVHYVPPPQQAASDGGAA